MRKLCSARWISPIWPAAAGVSFDAVFASSIFRTAYGAGFLGSGQDMGGYAASLAEMQVAYLVTGPRM